jgi:hypothetical protein
MKSSDIFLIILDGGYQKFKILKFTDMNLMFIFNGEDNEKSFKFVLHLV